MAIPMDERIRRANAGRTAGARRARFQKALGEMRDHGLVVLVREELPDGQWRDAPDYTVEAVHAALGR